jgi:hypothetical protein
VTTILDALAAAVAATDRLDWRIDYDEEAEEWAAWFHPEWEADDRAVVRVVLADDEPSKNELACMAALQHMLAHAPALLAVAQAAQELRAARADIHAEERGAWGKLFAALAPLTKEAGQ